MVTIMDNGAKAVVRIVYLMDTCGVWLVGIPRKEVDEQFTKFLLDLHE